MKLIPCSGYIYIWPAYYLIIPFHLKSDVPHAFNNLSDSSNCKRLCYNFHLRGKYFLLVNPANLHKIILKYLIKICLTGINNY